jgi:DNA-binding Lrp family transcriptional regulator
MVDLSSIRKNKIALEDYNYKQDIENRLLMAHFSSKDLDVLEEILYSSIKIPIRKLAKSVDLDEEEIFPILEKLSKTGLFNFEQDCIVVDKEMRKYFEAQMLKFDPDFKPGMEFLQSILRKVPIHVLPIWYSIPRTSNNIFDSLIEKYLLTPQIFQRYLSELNFSDPILTGIVHDVYNAPDLKVYGKDLIEKYRVSREQFEHCLLQLEFHFACCLGYEKVGEEWKEIVTPLHEWREYAIFLRNTETPLIPTVNKISRYRTQDFAYIQDLSLILSQAKRTPLSLAEDKNKRQLPSKVILTALATKMEDFEADSTSFADHIHLLIVKLRQLKLADVIDNRLYALESANDFLDMRCENRALFLYRHPLNRLFSPQIPADIITDRNLREAEKSILRVINSGWVYFDDFIRGVIAPLGEDSIVMLKRQGKTWKYSLPTYTEEELALIKATVLDWLFELGVTAVGKHNGKECFSVTSFGQSLFGR